MENNYAVQVNYAVKRSKMNDSLQDVMFSVNEIITLIKQQKVVAYPTESVFGLGCDPDSQLAVEALLKLKCRSWKKGLILIAANYKQLLPYIDDSQLIERQQQQMFESWPGPVTWVVPAKKNTPNWLTGQFTSIAVRVSDHPLVKILCQLYGKPLVSTSANLTGYPPCRTTEEVWEQFGKDFPVLSGKVGDQINPSQIRDIISGKLIRE